MAEKKQAEVVSLVPGPYLHELRTRGLVKNLIETLSSDEMDEVTDFVIVLRRRGGGERTQVCTQGGLTTLVGMLERSKFDLLVKYGAAAVEMLDPEA